MENENLVTKGYTDFGYGYRIESIDPVNEKTIISVIDIAKDCVANQISSLKTIFAIEYSAKEASHILQDKNVVKLSIWCDAKQQAEIPDLADKILDILKDREVGGTTF